MFVNVPVIADLIAIRQRCQLLIDKNLMRHNQKRYDYKYRIGEQVMVKVYDPKKGEPRLHGPYPITELNTNGTVRVRRDPNGYIEESYNLWKIEPYKGTVIQQPNPHEIQNLLNIHSKEFDICYFNHWWRRVSQD